uniref:Uncharacterized protein n=1 Tax=Cereibacter sphaeroides (strain ATCC 17025 / ATH 2.4.3) TaxID=349102 RepID=A4WS52_CERS5
MKRLSLALLLLVALAAPAHAGPVAAAVGMVFTAISQFAASSLLAGFLVQTAFSVGLSMLARALGPKVREPGIKTQVTQTGGDTPQSFVLGWSATGGQLIAPPMSHGDKNRYLVYVVALGAIPGQTLTRLIVNDEVVPISATPDADGLRPVTGSFAGYVRVRIHDGSQTAADPYLRSKFGADPDRPWSEDMIGRGVPYAIVEFKHKREVFNNLPSVRCEIQGIPLYDPRKDSSAGGSGSQRWASPATWTPTTNPIVMVYNIMRGIRLPDGNSWGGECAAGDLPLASWAAAMNECDVVPAGATAAQYRAGLEISVEEEPADVIEELLKACSGQIVDVGGTWKVRVGGPGLPVLFITDEDVLADQDQVLEPFPGLSDTWNGVHAAYPEPDSLWEVKDAPPRYNAAFEAADGGRRLVADLRLPAVPYRAQVQQLMEGWIREERRFLRHRLVLPPEAAVLEPLDAIGWSSSRHGYAAKSFEIFEMSDDLMTLSQSVGLRERDAGDYNWTASDLLPSPIAAPGVSAPPPITVPAFAASATVIRNASGVATRPAILMTWTGQEAEDARGLQWEVRVQATAETVAAGAVLAVESGRALVTEGILPETAYDVRAQLVSERATVWSGWISVTTPPVDYLDSALAARLAELDALAEAAADQAQDAALAAQGVREDHDALVAGFVGTLTDAFAGVDGQIATITANVNEIFDGDTGQVKASALSGYYSKAATDTAIAAARTALSGQITSGDTALQGQITSILGLTINPSSALATALTSLQSTVGSQSASISAQGTALATLQGNASASYVFRVKAGTAGAGLELVAATNPNGPVSVARISATDILLDGSVTMPQLAVTDFSGNLIINGSMPYGDTRGWTSMSSYHTVAARDTESSMNALRTAPTPHVLRLDAYDPSTTYTILADFPCSAGDRFSVSYAYAGGGTGVNAGIGLQFLFYGEGGEYIGAINRAVTVTGTIWQNYTASVAPASAVSRCRIRAYRSAGGVGVGFLTNMEVIRQRSGVTLLTPNSVTTALVNTEDFAASGLAVFGGELRSDNYNAATGTGWQLTKAGGLVVPNASIDNAKIGSEIRSNNFVAGSSGWRIQKNGTAEFDSVIIRRQMRVATGTFSIDWTRPGVASTGDWDRGGEIDTGHPAPLWSELKKVYIATLGLTNDAVATADFPEIVDQVWWDWNADTIINRTTWFGGATIRFKWAFRGDQYLRRIQGVVRWSLYEVT